ncbi:MAG: oligosaccharide flippase family protein [Candidatus Woesearchaeota archaeon]
MARGKKEIIGYAILSIISKIATYILLIIFANLFTEHEYGKAKFILSIFYIFTAFMCFGLPDSIVPFYIQYKHKLSGVFNFYLLFALIFSSVGILIFLDNFPILILAISSIFFYFQTFFIGIYQAKHKHHLYQLFRTLLQAIPIVFVFLFLRLGAEGIVLSYAITHIILGIIIIIMNYKETMFFLKPKINIIFFSKYLKYAVFVSAITYSYLFIGWIDSSILGLLSNFRNVALYNIAMPLSNIINLIPFTISMFLLTRISSVFKSEKLSYSILKRSIRISLFFSIIISVMLSSFIFLITRIFFSNYFNNVEAYFIILLIGAQLFAIYHLIYTYYAGRFEIRKAFIPILFAMMINIALDIFLIPKFGVFGIVFATLLAHLSAYTLLMNKVGLLKEFWMVYVLVLSIPLAFFLKYYGILLLAVIIPLMFYFRLIMKEDIKVVTDTLISFFKV